MNKTTTPEPEVDEHDAKQLKGRLKAIGGSMSDDWNNIVANQLVAALWRGNSDVEEFKKRRHAAVDALIGIGPRDDIEGMIAVQLIACHNSSMECYRRAMIGEQTFEGRRENLSQANKLSRTYATLLGISQPGTAEKDHRKSLSSTSMCTRAVKAIVGNLGGPGGGATSKSEEQPHALAYAPGATMPSADAPWIPVPGTSDAKRSMPDARRAFSGRTKGQ